MMATGNPFTGHILLVSLPGVCKEALAAKFSGEKFQRGELGSGLGVFLGVGFGHVHPSLRQPQPNFHDSSAPKDTDASARSTNRDPELLDRHPILSMMWRKSSNFLPAGFDGCAAATGRTFRGGIADCASRDASLHRR